MRTEYTVIEDIDYYKESIDLLFRIVNNNSFSNLKNEMLKRIDTRKHEKICYQLDKLSIIEEDIKKHTNLGDKDIQFFFKSFVFEEICIAQILYQSIRHTIFTGDKKAIKNYIKQYFENIKNDNNLELTLCSFEIETSAYENGQTVPFTDRIGNLECDAAQKWQILDLIEHSSDHLERLFDILDKTILRMREFDDILEQLKKESCDYWKEYFKENDFLKLVYRIFNYKEDSFPNKPAFIRPQIMSSNLVVFTSNDENAGDYHILDVGINIDSEFILTNNRLSNEQLCNGLKLLSDPSKFEILRFIKDRKAYGQEIAAELKLTTATISYHINALKVFGLIEIERVDNRVYYQLKKDAINNLLEEAKEALF